MRLTPAEVRTWRALCDVYAEDGRVTLTSVAAAMGDESRSGTTFQRVRTLYCGGLASWERPGSLRPVPGIAVDKRGVVYHEVCHAGETEVRRPQPEAAEGADEDDRLATAAAEDAGRVARDVGGLAVAR